MFQLLAGRVVTAHTQAMKDFRLVFIRTLRQPPQQIFFHTYVATTCCLANSLLVLSKCVRMILYFSNGYSPITTESTYHVITVPHYQLLTV